ncbi:protein-L-isoaspartate(D-aspartate) O-methyltransferase [Bacteroidota bacterium]
MNKFLLSLLIAFASFSCVHSQSEEEFAKERKQLVYTQLKPSGISDENVIDAMLSVKRHRFVPESYKAYSYLNRPLPIGYNQTISQPYIVAYMTQILKLTKNSKVLEIGTGSGYQAAILAELCDSVYSIEIIKELGIKAKNTLHDLGYTNIRLKIDDGYMGWPEHAPFDAIIVTCAPSKIPEPLKDQLAEGGSMIIPVGEEDSVQLLYLLKKQKGKLEEHAILPVRFVPMTDSERKTY